jgi:aminotransferase
MPGMAERTVVTDAFSKAYAMAGWRLGFALGPEWLIGKMPSTHDVTVACVNAPFQYAGAYALRNCDDEVIEMREKFRRRKDVIVSGIRSIPGMRCLDPAGTFYLWVNIQDLQVTSDELHWTVDPEHVAVVPGNELGKRGRVCAYHYASNEDLLARNRAHRPLCSRLRSNTLYLLDETSLDIISTNVII